MVKARKNSCIQVSPGHACFSAFSGLPSRKCGYGASSRQCWPISRWAWAGLFFHFLQIHSTWSTWWTEASDLCKFLQSGFQERLQIFPICFLRFSRTFPSVFYLCAAAVRHALQCRRCQVFRRTKELSAIPELFQHVFDLGKDVHAEPKWFPVNETQFFDSRTDAGQRKPGFLDGFIGIQPRLCVLVRSFWHGGRQELSEWSAVCSLYLSTGK